MTEDKLDKLRLLYELYIRYGGYPAVIRNYMESKDLEEATVVLSNMLELIQIESNTYMTKDDFGLTILDPIRYLQVNAVTD